MSTRVAFSFIKRGLKKELSHNEESWALFTNSVLPSQPSISHCIASPLCLSTFEVFTWSALRHSSSSVEVKSFQSQTSPTLCRTAVLSCFVIFNPICPESGHLLLGESSTWIFGEKNLGFWPIRVDPELALFPGKRVLQVGFLNMMMLAQGWQCRNSVLPLLM